MNIILMTILLTIFGVCLVAFLTWLGITSIQLMRFRKKAEGSLKHLERWIQDNQTSIINEIGIINNDNLKTFDEIRNKIDNNINDVHNRINNEVNDMCAKIDSRYDKLYTLNNNLLKETQKEVESFKK